MGRGAKTGGAQAATVLPWAKRKAHGQESTDSGYLPLLSLLCPLSTCANGWPMPPLVAICHQPP